MKDASAFVGSGFFVAILINFDDAVFESFFIVLPHIRREHLDILLGVFEVFLIAEVCAECTTTHIRILGTNSLASISPDACPATG